MENYEQKAIEFLNKTNSKLEVRFLRHDYYFPGDKETRDIFEVRLTRGTREYVFTYGDSIANYEELLINFFGDCTASFAKNVVKDDFNHFSDGWTKKRELNKLREKMKAWNKPGENYTPTAYSILACLDGYLYYDNVDDFAADFGYTKPSEALRTFEAVKYQVDKLQKLFNDKELEELNEIN